MSLFKKKKKKKKSEPVINQDIIDFRYNLIDKIYSDSNKLDPYAQKIYEELLLEFNIHFGTRGYDIG